LLAPLAKQFVWLAIDTEKPQNAPFVSRFGNRVWPTLWVIDPQQESVVLRWEGTATAKELVSLLTMTRAGAGPLAQTFLEANRAAARGDIKRAEHGYREVVEHKDFPERPRAVEALTSLLATRKEYGECARMAVAEVATMPNGTSRATVLAMGLSCAREAALEDSLRVLVAEAERVANSEDGRTIADDRSALFEEILETKQRWKDNAGVLVTARAWAQFLEREAARATTFAARAVFDAHRLSAYVALGAPERAVPMLERSEREFPDDYNPPARLARAYVELHRLEDANAAILRAEQRVYGPRSLRVFALSADIAKARGRADDERAALERGLSRTAHTELNESQKKLRASLEARLSALTAAKAP
jgi:hypothetical protein